MSHHNGIIEHVIYAILVIGAICWFGQQTQKRLYLIAISVNISLSWIIYLVNQTCLKLKFVLLTVLQLGVYLSIIDTLLTKEDGDKCCKGDRRQALGFVNLIVCTV